MREPCALLQPSRRQRSDYASTKCQVFHQQRGAINIRDALLLPHPPSSPRAHAARAVVPPRMRRPPLGQHIRRLLHLSHVVDDRAVVICIAMRASGRRQCLALMAALQYYVKIFCRPILSRSVLGGQSFARLVDNAWL